MKRRKVLQFMGLMTGAMIIPVGVSGWVGKSLAQTNSQKKLVVILLRGAVDGLNVVIPYAETAYYEARPLIAIPAEGEGRVLDLDGYFGLHPALASLMPLWKEKSLAFIHASGSPDPTRSHFDAQDYIESGTPGIKSTQNGWMNRLLAVLPKGTPTQAVNFGNTLPRILAGEKAVASQALGQLGTRSLPVDRPGINTAFDRLYSGKDALSLAYQEGRQAREMLLAEFEAEMMAASKGAPNASNFAAETQKVARLLVGSTQTQLAFLALGEWDTHVNQGSSTGQLAGHLSSLGEGLATLVRELGAAYKDTTIVVMSEFGRTVRENGNRGTDHGHGNVMWVLGGNVRGGKVYGDWRTLEESQLHEGRDLPVTTDFRDAIAPILTQHLNIPSSALSAVFPGYTANPLSFMNSAG